MLFLIFCQKHGHKHAQNNTVRGQKKPQKVNDNISTANEPISEIFFLRDTQCYGNFFWNIFGAHPTPQTKISAYLCAHRVSKKAENVAVTSKIEIKL